ncbi:hypothetical protein AGMMS49938_05970 [Fibrobacterales bacterium]|nr:hypothetical protein AGMMS49938_05970 [Fibrobacterales bacterium]
MKYLFVLTSKERDIYYEQTLVAITSLRIHNKNAFVSLLVDDQTAATLTGTRTQIKNLADELKIVELDKNLSPMLRSRWLKTVMRNEVDGDFLYMDSDIAIADDLSIPPEWDGYIYGVLDFHTNLSKAINRRTVLKAAKMLEYSPIENDEIFNGGVMFVRDNQKTREFFKRWHEQWLYCVSKGYNFDMASLAETNFEFGYIIKAMPGEWNCQLAYGAKHLEHAKVLHFFGSRIIDTHGHSVSKNGDYFLPEILRKSFYEDIKKTGEINSDDLLVIQNARESFLLQTKKVGKIFANGIRSYAFAKFLSFCYKRAYWLVKPLEWAGRCI